MSAIEVQAETPVTNSRSQFKEFALLVLLALIQFSFVVDYVLILPLGPAIMEAFDIKPGEYGVLISIYTFSAAFAGFFSSFIIDRFSRKKALLFCIMCFIFGNALCITSTNFYFLIAARIFSGSFGGILSSLVMIYLGDIFPVSKLGRTTSSVMIANGLATIIGVPAAIYFSEGSSWKSPFIILFIINISVLVLCFLFLPQVKKTAKKEVRKTNIKLLSYIKNPNFIWPIIFMSFLTFAGGSTILPFLSTFVSTNFGLSTEDIALMFFYGGLSALIINLFIGPMIDRFGKQNVFLLLNFFSIIPLLLLTTFPFDSKLAILIITTSFFCLSTAKSVSGITLVNSLFPREHRGRFISLTNSIQLLAGSGATVISGMLLYTENNYLMNFDILGVIGICATIICIFAAFVVEE